MTFTSFVDGLRRRSRTLAILFYTLLVTVLFGYAAAVRFTLPQQPFIDGDFWGYLHPVVSKLTGGVFQHTYGRDFLYPGFLYLLLKTFRDFRSISIAQHLFGLGTGGLILLAFWELCRLLCPAARGVRGFLLALLGLGVATAFLLAPSTVYFEQCIRTEGIFPFFAVLSILLNLAFIRLRWVAPEPRAAAWLGAASFLVAILLYKLKPAFGLGVIVAGLPLAVSFLTRGMSWRLKLLPLGGTVVFVVFALLLPERRMRADDPMAPLILPDLLYTIHADMIHDQMRDDLAGTAPLPFDRSVVEQLYQRLDEAIPLSRGPGCHVYPTLGFDPDYLLFVNKVFETARHPIKVWHLRPSIGYTYYFRVATRHPLRMLSKITTQMGCFYQFQPRPQFRFAGRFTRFHAGEYPRSLSRLYAGNLEITSGVSFHEAMDRFAPTIPYFTESRRLMETKEEIPLYPFAASLELWLVALYLPGLLAVLVTCGWTLLTSRGRSRWLVPSLAVLLIYGYNFGNNLTVAIIHSLEVGRYVENQSAYTYLASLAGLVFVDGVLRSAAAGASGKVKLPRLAPRGKTAFASLLPRLVGSGNAPSLSIVLISSRESQDGARARTNYRESFPAARLLMLGEAPGDATAAQPMEIFSHVVDLFNIIDTDLLLMVDDSQAHGPGALHGLLQSDAGFPTDLIIGVRSWEQVPETSAEPQTSRDVERVLPWLFGWKPTSLTPVAQLLSRRFYESLPVDLRAEFLPLELGLHALSEGYSLREVSIPESDETAAIVHLAEEGRSERRRMLGFMLMRGFELQPLRVLSVVAAGFVLLGAVMGYTPLHHSGDKKHQISHTVQGTLAYGLLAAALLSLQTGIILQCRLREDRKARQLRLRGAYLQR